VLAALDIPATWMPRLAEGPVDHRTGQRGRAGAHRAKSRVRRSLAAAAFRRQARLVSGAVETAHRLAGGRYVRRSLRAAAAVQLYEPQGRLLAFCHAVPGMWTSWASHWPQRAACIGTRDTLAPGEKFDDLLAPGQQRFDPGSDWSGLRCYLSGERTPFLTRWRAARSSA